MFVPSYRLAPENKFSAPVDDAVAAYHHVIVSGSGAERTIAMGDSSGGGLAMATVLALRDRGDPLPAGVVTLSTWADLECAGATMSSRTGLEITCTRVGLLEMAEWYLAGASATDPLASPVYGDLAGLPPLLALVGGDEVLLDDSVRLVRGIGEGGSDVTLFVGAGMQHVWPTWPARSRKQMRP